MRVVFAGTPAFAVPTLQALLHSRHQVVAVYTQPDRPAGRGRRPRASPVKQLALSNHISVMQPSSLRDAPTQDAFSALQPALMVVVAYGLILPAAMLAIPAHGCLNAHASLLPRWRGAAPIQRAILAGDTTTGVTVMRMNERMDAGDILKLSATPLSVDTSAQCLHDKLSLLAADALLEIINKIDQGDTPPAVAQDDAQASYAAKISKSEAVINWDLPAVEVLRRVKAFNPWPVAFTRQAGKTLRIWDADVRQWTKQAAVGELVAFEDGRPVIACARGALVLLEVQPEGGKRMAADAYMNARKAQMTTGTILGGN